MDIEKTTVPLIKSNKLKSVKDIGSSSYRYQMPNCIQNFYLYQPKKGFSQIVFKRESLEHLRGPNPFFPDTFESNGNKKYSRTRENKKNGNDKDTKPVEPGTIKENHEKLYAKYLQLLDEISHLKSENEKLKTSAYKSYDDLKEEVGYEISRATSFKDSLLILLELKENKNLNYQDLKDRVTEPGNLFLRLADLSAVHFIAVTGKSGYFSITPRAIEFLERRGF